MSSLPHGAATTGETLAAALAPLRPWSNVPAVEGVLRVWGRDHGLDVTGQTDIAGEAAEVLANLGRYKRRGAPDPNLTDATIADIAAGVMRNLAAGRAQDDYGPLIVYEPAQARTLRHQRLAAERRLPGARPVDQRAAAEQGRMERLQRTLDIAELVHGGRTRADAQRWLRDNPGCHARDAGPPRPRGARL